MAGGKRVPVDGSGGGLGQSPFASLSAEGLPGAPRAEVVKPAAGSRKEPNRNRGRVDVVRETAGRAGKTVTVIRGFTGIGLPEKEELARRLRQRCGVGGSVKDGAIELQGDCREAAEALLAEAGFRPVRTGG